MIRVRRIQGAAAMAAAAAITLTGACARQGAPPGGPEDRRPPVVVRTEPDTFALAAEDFRGPIRFHFDERISERPTGGSMDDMVVVSPATGNVRVNHSRQTLSVELEGGFRRDIVYRVTLLPGVSDLFSNSTVDPFELVFSTGATFSPTAVAGLVWDRISGEGLEPAEVRAISEEGDTVVYVARTDTEGVYALRYLPPGRYRFVAFQDRNRDGIVDPGETQGSRGILLNSPTDTVALHIGVLTPDTTPARITSVEILDSVTLAVELDDYLDPAVALEFVGASLTPDTSAMEEAVDPAEAPAVRAVYHEHDYRALVEAVTDSFARLDSLDAVVRAAEARAEAEAAAEDTTTAAEDTTAATEVGAEVAEEGAAPPLQEMGPRRVPPVALSGGPARDAPRRPDGSLAPSRMLVVILQEGLPLNQPYRLEVTGVENIGGVPQGGGEAAVVLTPPPDTTALSDSTAVGDTVPDPDTLTAPPDTGAVAWNLRDLVRMWRRD